MGNCDNIEGTLYYSWKCPKGYKWGNLGCEYDCQDLEEEGEFCVKKIENKTDPCPELTIPEGELKCLKPNWKYFIWIINPFNNKY